MTEPVATAERTTGLNRGLILLFAVACGLSVANLYYAQTVLGSIAKSFHSGSATVGLTVTLAQVGYAPVLASKFSRPENVMCQLSTRPGDCEKNNGDTFAQVVISMGNEISKATLASMAGLNRFCPRPP